MKLKRFMSVFLATAMIITSLPAGNVLAAETTVDDALVASYDFDDETLENSVVSGDEAKAIVTGLKDYTGTVAYEEGRNGSKALKLGDYGLELNQDNLGTNFTVSAWMKLSGTYAVNQSGFFLGYHSPENWLGLAGAGGNSGKIWGRDGGYSEFGNYEIGNEWHSYTFAGDESGVTVYIDGVYFAKAGGFKPLNGQNQDIYVGVNYWDSEFTGLVDDIKVYNVTLTEEEVQALDKESYEASLQEALNNVSVESLLGNNKSADEIKFNLTLPKQLDGKNVTWTSSDADIIAADGTVTNPEQDTKVTVTATLASGILSATKTFDFTVRALSTASLDELIVKAESLDSKKYTKETMKNVLAAAEEAKDAATFEEIDAATTNLYLAIANLAYIPEYQDPFAYIKTPAEVKDLAVGASEQIVSIPAEIRDKISVEYFSSNSSIASYANGKVTALKNGRVTVTAIVTANYDGSMEEYSTVLNIGTGAAVEASVTVENEALLAANDGKQITEPTEGPLTIRESEINQLLTGDLELPSEVKGAVVEYSIDESNPKYVALDGTTLKITRPFAGEGNYTFVLTATVDTEEETIVQKFPLTIAEGISSDTYAGYVYLCFGNRNGGDVQQVHLFLSEDGLNWTAVNGFNPIFEVGEDYADMIEEAGTHNYTIAEWADISETVSGDASVLFPFEGDDQGIRDPYILRGAREEDSNKVWILATDLNTMSSQYGGNLNSNRVGNWGTMSSRGSTNIFVYETEDWIHWERRYIDVGSEIGAGAAWAPEAVYNPEKDNYLVYWSCRVNVDGLARNRVYCNETEDFVTFGPTKLYEQEPNYADWGRQLSGNDGYGNIDTSQLWVADKETGNPYGTLFRVVKDETDNHIELKSAKTVLDPDVDYDETDPTRITPYTFNGVERASTADLSGLNDYQKAEVVWNWFAEESTGDHFEHISQSYMESRNETNGAFEGATMFKFNDRDEWCIMIDNYSSSSIRYEPYVTTDLSEPDSITKVTSGYGRTGGDVGCHGGMMPITASEYNTIIDIYNSDPSVDNYHPIDYIEGDKRDIEALVEDINEKLSDEAVSDELKAKLSESLIRAESMLELATISEEARTGLISEVENYLTPETVEVSSEKIGLKVDGTKTVEADGEDLIWYSADEQVATVENGTIKAVGNGSTFVFVRSGKVLAKVQVIVGDGLPYEDVINDSWYYEAVEYNYNKGTMTGTTDVTFAPEAPIVRGQFASIVHRLAGEEKVTFTPEFPDVSEGDWFMEPVLWAKANSIVSGYKDGSFGPNDNIIREQIAIMLHNYATYKKYDTTASVDLDEFVDGEKVSSWAVPAMKWAVANGIISGTSAKELKPHADATRAECAAMIMNFMVKFVK